MSFLRGIDRQFELYPLAWGVGLACTGAVLFSGKAIVVKLAYAYPVDAVTLLALRMLLSLPIFLAILIWSQLKSNHPLKLGAKDLGLIVVAGLLGYYLASLLDFMGLQYISAALERLILFTYPSIVLLLHCLIGRTAPSLWQLLCMGVSYAGLAIVYGHEVVFTDENTALGAILVLMSALSYSCYLLLGERLLKKLGTIRVTALATLVSAVAVFAHSLSVQPLDVVFDQPPAVWGLSVINATLCTVVPVFSIMTAIKLVGAPRVAQIGMIGPVATLMMGYVILSEPFTEWHGIGTAFVIGGVAMLNLKRAKTTKPTE